jgi:hypothetical protein
MKRIKYPELWAIVWATVLTILGFVGYVLYWIVTSSIGPYHWPALAVHLLMMAFPYLAVAWFLMVVLFVTMNRRQGSSEDPDDAE